MDILANLHAATPWIALAAIGLLLLLLLFLLYRQWRKTGEPLRLSQGILLSLLSCWSVAALAIHLLYPGTGSGQINLHPFSSLLSAWNQWSSTELCLILLHIGLFLPFGLLFPLVAKPFRQLRWVLPSSLVCTLVLECIGFIAGRGCVSLDVLLQNTLGTLIGYFLAQLLLAIQAKKPLLPAIGKVLLLPLCMALALGTAFALYNLQEFGNLPISPTYRQPIARAELTLDTHLSEASGSAAVYQNTSTNNPRQGDTIASLLAKELDLTLSPSVRQIGSERRFSLSDPEGNSYSISFSLRTGNWKFVSLSGESVTVSGDLDRIRWKWESWLTENQLLDKTAVYSLTETGTLRWDLESPENLSRYQNDFTAGSITVTLARGNIPESIYNFMSTYQYCHEVAILSPAEAYQQIERGHFSLSTPLQAGDQLVINGCQLAYLTDTKGYYQPVYQFTGYLNHPSSTVCITVPARK